MKDEFAAPEDFLRGFVPVPSLPNQLFMVQSRGIRIEVHHFFIVGDFLARSIEGLPENKPLRNHPECLSF